MNPPTDIHTFLTIMDHIIRKRFSESDGTLDYLGIRNMEESL